MYVCSNCRTGDFFEAEEVLVPEHQPHGELLHFEECPRCADREHLVGLDGDGKERLFSMARKHASQDVRWWATGVLYELATGQVAA